MSRGGNCRDKAVVKSIFISLKNERSQKRNNATREAAIFDVADYIDGF